MGIVKGWKLSLAFTLLLAAAACAQSPDELLASARQAMASGEMRTAEIHLKNLLQQAPNNADARFLLGQLLLGNGDSAGAEENLRRALDLGVDPSQVQLPLLQALVSQGKFDAALDQFAKGPELTGAAQVNALIVKGVAERALRNTAQAEATLRAALELDPDSAPVKTELASLLLALQRSDEARALVDQVLADQPDSRAALLLRGTLEFSAGNGAAAEAALNRVVELDPADRPGSTPQGGAALAQLVEWQLAAGAIDKAEANADKLLAANPRNPVSRALKAAVELGRNQLDDAERRLQSVVADFPQYWTAHRLLGTVNLRQGKLAQAQVSLRPVVANVPGDTAARVTLAEVYVRDGNIDAAKVLLQGSDAMRLNDTEFFAFVANVSQRAGLTTQAEEYFKRSEEQPPEDARSLLGMTNLYLASGELERAARMLEASRLTDPSGEALSQYLLAVVQLRQGDTQGASQTTAKLVAEHPDVAWAHLVRGFAEAATGNADAAEKSFDRALEIEPNNVQALASSARLALSKNDTAGADALFKRLLEINPNDPVGTLGLAQLARTRGDFEQAHALLARAPNSPARDEIEGEVFFAEGKFAESADALSRAYSVQPRAALAVRTSVAARRANRPNPDAELVAWTADHPDDSTANFFLGQYALERSDLDAAIKHYEIVVDSQPNQAAALNNLAWLYGERKDPRAIQYGERARAAAPDSGAIADTLGWLYVSQGDAARGLPLVAEAAAALPKQMEIQYHWGVALAETGDTAKAREVLGAVVASGEQFNGKEDAEKRLAALGQ